MSWRLRWKKRSPWRLWRRKRQRRPSRKSSRRARRKWKAKKAPRRKPSPRRRRPTKARRARRKSNAMLCDEGPAAGRLPEKRIMRLIVGLGNPDPEYQWTPHNLGFMTVDELANRNGIRVERPEGKALVGRGKIAGEEVILAKPQTYMNLSGISVRELLQKYELDVKDLLV